MSPAIVDQIETLVAPENEAFFASFAKCENIYRDRVEVDDFIDLRTMTFGATSVIDVVLGLLVKMDHRIAKLERMSSPPRVC